MKIIFVLALLLSAFTISACKDNSTTSNSAGSIQDIFPLAVGDHWVYDVKEYREDGSLKNEMDYDVLVRSSQTFQGHQAFELSQNHDTSGRSLSYYQGSSDLYQVDVPTGQVTLGFHYPINIGESFISRDTIDNGSLDKTITTLISNNEQVTTPSGNYTCLRFDEIDLSGSPAKPDTISIKQQYYAIGKGLVQEMEFGLNSSKKLFQIYLANLKSIDIK